MRRRLTSKLKLRHATASPFEAAVMAAVVRAGSELTMHSSRAYRRLARVMAVESVDGSTGAGPLGREWVWRLSRLLTGDVQYTLILSRHQSRTTRAPVALPQHARLTPLGRQRLISPVPAGRQITTRRSQWRNHPVPARGTSATPRAMRSNLM
jgi:hypothetical protein